MASLSQYGLFVLLLHIVSPSACDGVQIFQNTNLSADALLNIPARLMALEQTMAIIVGELEEDRSSCKKKLIQETDIVEDIIQGRFAIAEKQMLELQDPAIVANIVRDMSATSDHEFGVLLNLTKRMNDNTLRSQILVSLYYQANDRDHISLLNLIALAKCLSAKRVGYQEDGVLSISSLKKLLDKIAENTIATFVDVMKWRGDYRTNSKVRALAADIAEWRDVSQKVMMGLVSGVFGNVDNKKILEAVSSHTDAWQALVGVDTLVERLKDTDPFKGSIALEIAIRLNEILTRKNLDSTVKNNALRVAKKIPECIRNLTKKDFRLWNKYKGFFLTHSGYSYKKFLGSIVLAPSSDNCTERDTWRLHNYDEKLALRLFTHVWTLQASNISTAASGGFHRVFTGGYDDRLLVLLEDKHAWILETAGGSCYLKNYWNNEYLYASDANIFNDGLKIAGTKAKPSGSAYDNPEFAWQFIDC